MQKNQLTFNGIFKVKMSLTKYMPDSLKIKNAVSFCATADILKEKRVTDTGEVIKSYKLKILDCLLSGGTLNDLLDISSECINNPMMAFDITTNVLAISKKHILQEYDDDVLQDVIRHGRCSYEYMVKYQIPKIIELTKKNDRPFILDSYYAVNMRRMMTPIFINQEMCAYLSAFEITKKFSEFDLRIMEILANACSSVLNNSSVILLNMGNSQKNIILNLLVGEFVDKSVWQELYRSFVSRECNYHYVLSIKANAPEREVSLIALAKYLDEFDPDIQAVYFKSGIVALLSLQDRNIPTSLIDLIKRFLDENNLNAGVSEWFQDIADLNKYYLQADHILEVGMSYRPEINLYLYHNFFLLYLFRCLDRFVDLKNFIMPEIKILIEYDNSNNTRYLETLCAYIDNQKNVANAALTLFIHRNSLRYRLRRIEYLTGINLDNLEDYNRIAFSCSICRYYKYF